MEIEKEKEKMNEMTVRGEKKGDKKRRRGRNQEKFGYSKENLNLIRFRIHEQVAKCRGPENLAAISASARLPNSLGNLSY